MEKGRHYEDWVERVIKVTAKAKSPEIFRRWAACSAVAGALQRKVWFAGTANQGYRLGSNLFIVLLGGSTAGKTTALNMAFQRVFKKLANPLQLTGKDSPLWKESYKNYGLSKSLRIATESVTPESLVSEMARHLSKPDLNLSKILDEEMWYDSSVTIMVTEFGAFMKKRDENMSQFLTDMWDGRDEYSHSTKTVGKDLALGPCVNGIFCAVPSVFKDSMPRNAQIQGIMSRMLIVYYDGPGYLTDAPSGNDSEDKAMEAEARWLAKDLAEIAEITGSYSWDGGEGGELHMEADAWCELGCPPIPTDPRMAEYCGRRAGQVFKLSMVMSAARNNSRVVERRDFIKARNMVLAAEVKMPAGLNQIGFTEMARKARDIAAILVLPKNKHGMSEMKFRNHLLGFSDVVMEYEPFFKAMQTAGIVTLTENLVTKGPNFDKTT